MNFEYPVSPDSKHNPDITEKIRSLLNAIFTDHPSFEELSFEELKELKELITRLRSKLLEVIKEFAISESNQGFIFIDNNDNTFSINPDRYASIPNDKNSKFQYRGCQIYFGEKIQD